MVNVEIKYKKKSKEKYVSYNVELGRYGWFDLPTKILNDTDVMELTIKIKKLTQNK